MIQLHADSINKKAPYQVEQIDDVSFRFKTKYGLTYLVGFSRDYMFLEDGAYQFYIIEENHAHGRADHLILLTIIAVIEEFFACDDAVMLYICDSSDQKHSVRNRLFQYWFKQYEHNDKYLLSTEHIVIDDTPYFAGLLLSKANPQAASIVIAFHQFALDLLEKLSTTTDNI